MSNILIIDDDKAILESLKILLEEEGYKVFVSEDGGIVKNDFDGRKPDIILLDHWLIGENGGEIAKKLKNQKDTKNIPIIMISASNNIENICLEAGVDDFISKPYDIDDLLGKIKENIS